MGCFVNARDFGQCSRGIWRAMGLHTAKNRWPKCGGGESIKFWKLGRSSRESLIIFISLAFFMLIWFLLFFDRLLDYLLLVPYCLQSESEYVSHKGIWTWISNPSPFVVYPIDVTRHNRRNGSLGSISRFLGAEKLSHWQIPLEARSYNRVAIVQYDLIWYLPSARKAPNCNENWYCLARFPFKIQL